MAAPVLQFKRGNAGVAGTVPALRPGEPAISLNNFDFFIGIDTSVTNNKFFGSHRYWGREDGTTSLKLKLVDKDGTNGVHLKSPDTLSGIGTYTLPDTSTIQNGYFLKVATDGTLSWDTAGGTNGTFTNPSFAGITTVTGTFDNNANSDFSGITTFSNTTDNTLGNSNTGAVQIDGGVGIDKNLTVGGNLNVQGYSEFVGVVTFKSGTINLGDDAGDNINVGGEFTSGLYPNTTNTYDLGDSTRQWRHASFAGVGTFSTGVVADGVQIGINGANVIDTVSGNLTLNSAGGQTIIDDLVTIQNNLTVNGNITVGGTTVSLRGTDVFIENKDIILGYTTSITPNDDTANHGGVAIASTIGSPLVSFSASGINTLPDTYKQMMWFKSGTLGFSTDAFAFNYGVAIGTTTMANGVRLAVGTGVTISDTAISATNGYFTNISATNIIGSLSGTISTATRAQTVDTTADGTNTNYHLVFTDNATSTTGATMKVDAGIYYNPSTNNLFATQFNGNVSAGTIKAADATTSMTLANSTGDVTFNNNITVPGTITGTATTATRATTVDTTATSTNADYYVPFVDTLAGQNGETIRVGAGLSVNPSTGEVKTGGVLSVGNPTALTSYIKAGGGSNAMYLYGNGDVSFQSKLIAAQIRSNDNATTLITLSGLNATFAQDIKVTGITTTGTLVLNGTPGVAITAISSSTTLAENSNAYLPTQAAVKAYVDAVDLTTSLAGDSGTGSVSTSQTLTIAGTAGEIETAASGQTITIGLPNDVVVGTSLSSPTVKTATIQHRNGTQAATIDTSGNIIASQNLTVGGNLYVNGSTTQVNTTELTVYDRTVTLGIQTGSTPTTTSWDLGILMNYGDAGVAKTAGVIWEHTDKRFKFSANSNNPPSLGDTSSPDITVSTFAPIEIGSLWVNDCAGVSQVISCTGTTRNLENITIDAGSF